MIYEELRAASERLQNDTFFYAHAINEAMIALTQIHYKLVVALNTDDVVDIYACVTENDNNGLYEMFGADCTVEDYFNCDFDDVDKRMNAVKVAAEELVTSIIEMGKESV